MTDQDKGASVNTDRAGELRSQPATPSEPRALIPCAGDTFNIVYPFVRETYSGFDGEGYADIESWRPGINFISVSEDHSAPVADAVGSAVFTVVDTFKPGRFPMRVFFTRQFVSPDGATFGKSGLHIVTLEKFRRLARGYQHPFGVGKPLLSDHQFWRKGDAQREFEEMLAALRDSDVSLAEDVAQPTPSEPLSEQSE